MQRWDPSISYYPYAQSVPERVNAASAFLVASPTSSNIMGGEGQGARLFTMSRAHCLKHRDGQAQLVPPTPSMLPDLGNVARMQGLRQGQGTWWSQHSPSVTETGHHNIPQKILASTEP